MALRVPVDFLKPSLQGAVELPADSGHYVVRVHRSQIGERLLLFDPAARLQATAELLECSPAARVQVLSVEPATAPARRIIVIQALAKGAKVDAVIRDATELGASVVVPAAAERSVPLGSGSRLARWRRIALDAARQCGRGDVVEVPPICSAAQAFERWLPPPQGGLGLLLHPAASTAFGRLLKGLEPHSEVVCAIGPEGGWAPSELDLARTLGYEAATMGPRVLRTETVCAAVLGALLLFEPCAHSHS